MTGVELVRILQETAREILCGFLYFPGNLFISTHIYGNARDNKERMCIIFEKNGELPSCQGQGL